MRPRLPWTCSDIETGAGPSSSSPSPPALAASSRISSSCARRCRSSSSSRCTSRSARLMASRMNFMFMTPLSLGSLALSAASLASSAASSSNARRRTASTSSSSAPDAIESSSPSPSPSSSDDANSSRSSSPLPTPAIFLRSSSRRLTMSRIAALRSSSRPSSPSTLRAQRPPLPECLSVTRSLARCSSRRVRSSSTREPPSIASSSARSSSESWAPAPSRSRCLRWMRRYALLLILATRLALRSARYMRSRWRRSSAWRAARSAGSSVASAAFSCCWRSACDICAVERSDWTDASRSLVGCDAREERASAPRSR